MLYLAGGPLCGRDPHRAVREDLSRVYEAVTGGKMPPLVQDAGGKPRFSEGGLHCSLTHTRWAAFCALSDRPLGLDAEALGRRVSPALAARILLPEEQLQYQASQDPGRCLLTFWVLKEAYVKYTGQGLSGLMDAGPFDLSHPRLLGPRGRELRFTLLTRDGHLIALCSPLWEVPQFL